MIDQPKFGVADLAEMQEDAVVCAVHDQLGAALDVITDGEQTRLDFNLSFYGYLEGIELESSSPRRLIRTVPAATKLSRLPSLSTMPQPQRLSPGSMPMIRVRPMSAKPYGSAANLPSTM